MEVPVLPEQGSPIGGSCTHSVSDDELAWFENTSTETQTDANQPPPSNSPSPQQHQFQPSINVSPLHEHILKAVNRLDYSSHSLNLPSIISKCKLQLETVIPLGYTEPTIPQDTQGSRKSWELNYSVISFLMNGQRYADYQHIGSMLGLPGCSNKQWQRIVGWVGEHVTKLADWSCKQVRAYILFQNAIEHSYLLHLSPRDDQQPW